MLSSLLPQIRETWGNTSSSASLSLLLSTTYSALNLAAMATNKVTMLGEKFKPKPKTSKIFSASSKYSLHPLHNIRKLESSPLTSEYELEEARQKLASIRYKFKREVRDALAKDRDTRDTKLHDILSNPATVFRSLRAAAKKSSPEVKRMKVGNKVYEGQTVADGMFESLNTLKAPNMEEYSVLPSYREAVETYRHIMKLASSGKQIPLLSVAKGEKLLKKI